MILETFGQDLRLGLRIFFKEKSFCLLAILVLALGIGGAMTQFAVVNAIVLRGFSFPHPEELVSVGLIDPKASDQNNNFGSGNIPPGFEFPVSEEPWTPLYNEWPPTPRGELFLGANTRAPAVIGRLKANVTLDQANAEMIAIARNMAADNPKTNQNFTSAAVMPLLKTFTAVQLRQTVWAMLG